MDFVPEISATPTTLNSVQVLSQLPEAYLAAPNASNYVALGVVYCLMGLGTPDDPTYIDRVLAGVFTALNDKAVTMGLPAFEPPATLSPVATTKTSALIDAYLMHHADASLPGLNLDVAKQVLREIFQSDPHTADSHPHPANAAIDRLREIGLPCPVSTSMGGTMDYDGMLASTLRKYGVPEDYIQDGISFIITERLLPDSNFIQKFDPSRATFMRYFLMAKKDWAINFKRTLAPHLTNEISPITIDSEGNEVSRVDSTPADSENPLEILDEKDISAFISEFRDYLETQGAKYAPSRNGVPDVASLVLIWDLLLKGYKGAQVQEELNLTSGPYRDRYLAIKSVGARFVRNPRHAEAIRSIFQAF